MLFTCSLILSYQCLFMTPVEEPEWLTKKETATTTLPTGSIHSPREYAKTLLSEQDFEHFDYIINHESAWSERWYGAHYASSIHTASGICGFINATWSSVGYEKTEDPYVQVRACITYAESRYVTLEKAHQHHVDAGWW